MCAVYPCIRERVWMMADTYRIWTNTGQKHSEVELISNAWDELQHGATNIAKKKSLGEFCLLLFPAPAAVILVDEKMHKSKKNLRWLTGYEVSLIRQ